MNAGLPRMAAVTALVSLLAATVSAQSEPAVGEDSETGPPAALQPAGLDDPWAPLEPEFPEHERHLLERRPAERPSPVLAGRNDNSQRSWTRTLGALAGVVGLIVLLAWGYRAMAGSHLPLLGKTRRPGLIEVITKMPLSTRQSLCLVRIGPRLVLIGQSQDTLRALDVIDDADLAAKLAGEAAGSRPDSSRTEFRECLERQARGYHERADDIDETTLPEAQRIAAVRQGVTDTIRRIRRAVARA